MLTFENEDINFKHQLRKSFFTVPLRIVSGNLSYDSKHHSPLWVWLGTKSIWCLWESCSSRHAAH
ncbi:CLUMA_CG018291, isoform A [Clunio marinus]|uniref:CLUMA_CG018291, isoform A n=1 Tax=Clunio marinus TaxID=568069 RepID=A0A1J1IZ51_9DIPT|nr:CLUMA_CG018291, isoform A [Clunio marinus]